MPAPSLVVYKDAYTSSLGAVTTRVLTQITVATGDVVAVVAEVADIGQQVTALAKTAGTSAIGTITLNQANTLTSQCGIGLFTFTVTSGGTLTLTATFNASVNAIGNTFWTYVATGCGGVGNTGKTQASTLPTVSLTTGNHSYVIAHAADWSATGAATTTLTPAGSTLDAHETDGVADQAANGTQFSSRGGHWPDVAAGTVAYGISAPTLGTNKYSQVACELLAGPDTAAMPAQAREHAGRRKGRRHGAQRSQQQASFSVPAAVTPAVVPVVILTSPATATMDGSVW
jgi:hypothetical protein